MFYFWHKVHALVLGCQALSDCVKITVKRHSSLGCIACRCYMIDTNIRIYIRRKIDKVDRKIQSRRNGRSQGLNPGPFAYESEAVANSGSSRNPSNGYESRKPTKIPHRKQQGHETSKSV